MTDPAIRSIDDAEIATAEELLGPSGSLLDNGKLADLAARIQFIPEKGQIWLDDRRMGLFYCDAFACLRSELIDHVGIEKARSILTHMGYQSGVADAEVSLKVRKRGEVFDAFAAGPQLHGLEGFVNIEEVRSNIDVEAGIFDAEYIWRDSFEARAHLMSRGESADPVCWMQIGYAAGFASAFTGRQIVYKEVQCIGMGHDHCRLLGKPAEEWDDPSSSMHFVDYDPSKTIATRTPIPSQMMAASSGRFGGPALVGASTAFNRAYHLLKKAAIADIHVVLRGEFGVGKDAFARHMHSLGSRKGSEFVYLSCGTIDTARPDSDLFGLAKGALSETSQPVIGPIERAKGGTLFLSNVEDLPLTAQAKLLEFLQSGRIRRLGSGQDKSLEVRVVASASKNLSELVEQGKFLEGLFYRLNAFSIEIPPLRERRADLSMVLERCLLDNKAKYHKEVSGFTDRAIAAAMAYDWPGNIWEVANRIERAVVICEDGEAIDFSHLFLPDDHIDFSVFRLNAVGELQVLSEDDAQIDNKGREPSRAVGAISSLLDHGISAQDVTDLLIRNALRRSGGNQSAAARLLGMTRSQIQYRLKQMAAEAE